MTEIQSATLETKPTTTAPRGWQLQKAIDTPLEPEPATVTGKLDQGAAHIGAAHRLLDDIEQRFHGSAQAQAGAKSAEPNAIPALHTLADQVRKGAEGLRQRLEALLAHL